MTIEHEEFYNLMQAYRHTGNKLIAKALLSKEGLM